AFLYNEQTRTNMKNELKTMNKVSKNQYIVALNDAIGDLEYEQTLKETLPSDFALYSGNDDNMYDYYKLGGEGLISVVANAIPQETQKLFDLVQKDDTKTAENLRDQILSLLNDLGVDVNPIPIKLLTSELGFGQYEVRLPLVTLDEQE